MKEEILNDEKTNTLLSLLECNGIIPYLNDLKTPSEHLKEYCDYSLDFLYIDENILFKPEELYHLLKNSILKEYDTDTFSDICMIIHCRLLFSL